MRENLEKVIIFFWTKFCSFSSVRNCVIWDISYVFVTIYKFSIRNSFVSELHFARFFPVKVRALFPSMKLTPVKWSKPIFTVVTISSSFSSLFFWFLAAGDTLAGTLFLESRSIKARCSFWYCVSLFKHHGCEWSGNKKFRYCVLWKSNIFWFSCVSLSGKLSTRDFLSSLTFWKL